MLDFVLAAAICVSCPASSASSAHCLKISQNVAFEFLREIEIDFGVKDALGAVAFIAVAAFIFWSFQRL